MNTIYYLLLTVGLIGAFSLLYTPPVFAATDCSVSNMNVTKTGGLYDLTLVYQASDGSDTFVRNFYNRTGLTTSVVSVQCSVDYYISGYFDPTFSTSGTGAASVANIPTGYKSDFTYVSKRAPDSPNPIGLEPLGTIFGMPLVFIFIIALGSIFTPRSAPMGLIIVAVAMGIMAYLGYISFDFDVANQSNIVTWALIIIAVAVGVFVGKRYD